MALNIEPGLFLHRNGIGEIFCRTILEAMNSAGFFILKSTQLWFNVCEMQLRRLSAKTQMQTSKRETQTEPRGAAVTLIGLALNRDLLASWHWITWAVIYSWIQTLRKIYIRVNEHEKIWRGNTGGEKCTGKRLRINRICIGLLLFPRTAVFFLSFFLSYILWYNTIN